MKCPNCGGDSKGPVCDYCGTQLAEPPKPRPAAQTPVPPPVYPQPPATPPSSPPRRRLPHLLAAVVILAAAVSLVTGAFAYMAAPGRHPHNRAGGGFRRFRRGRLGAVRRG